MISVKRFLDHYAAALEQGDSALFVGAGLSRPAGFVDWHGLMRDIAEELGLDVDKESDLIALAQYHVNTARGRARIDRLIIDEFTREAQPTTVHQTMARLPVRTVWTTNYDTLVEDAFAQIGKRVDAKRVPENIAVSLPRRDVVVYKMHGDVADPARAVLTKEDYETYSASRQAFVTTLQADLLTKTFLFLGFSFSDPNLEYVLGRIRGLLGEHQREHYCLMKPPARPEGNGEKLAEYEYAKRKFDLRIADLQRYSIQTVILSDYGDIEPMLMGVLQRARRRTVFVSGSASDFGEYSSERMNELGAELGRSLIDAGYRLVTGLGLGVGAAVLVGAMRRLYAGDAGLSTEEQLSVRPFPLGIEDGQERRRIWSNHRRSMLSEAGFAIFIAGNRINDEGVIEPAPGVLEEFEIAEMEGVVPVPVGATGSVAKEIWDRVVHDPARYYGNAEVAHELIELGNTEANVDRLTAAVMNLITKVSAD